MDNRKSGDIECYNVFGFEVKLICSYCSLPFEASTSSSGTKLRTISVSKFQDGTAESIKACIENQLKDYGVLSVHVPNPRFVLFNALFSCLTPFLIFFICLFFYFFYTALPLLTHS